MSGVFIILNEWTDIQGASNSEVVDSAYFESESEAWDALLVIAQSYNTTLFADETSIQFEDHKPHLQYEEYYIQELTKK